MSSGWHAEAAWSVVARDFEGFLVQLRAIGITNIEFSLWNGSRLNRLGPAFEIEQIETHAETIIGAGLQIALHPYSHIDHRGPAYFAPETQEDVIAHLEAVIDYGHHLATRQKSPAHIVFHAAECLGAWEDKSLPEEAVRSLLLSRSRKYFKKVDDYAKKIRANVRLFCEIVPTPSRGMRIGDRPSELYTMIIWNRSSRLSCKGITRCENPNNVGGYGDLMEPACPQAGLSGVRAPRLQKLNRL